MPHAPEHVGVAPRCRRVVLLAAVRAALALAVSLPMVHVPPLELASAPRDVPLLVRLLVAVIIDAALG